LDETTRLFVGEHGYGTDPYNPDTDLDGLWDGYTPTGNPPYTGDVIIGFQTVYIENGKVLTPNENLDLTDYYFKIHGELTTKTCATKSDTDGDGISDGAEINGYYLYDYVWPKDHFKGQEGEPGIGASNLPLDNALFVLEPNGYIEVPIIPEPAVAGMKYYAIQFTASACCAYNLAPTSTFEVKAYDKNDNELASFSKTISLTFRNIEQNEYPYQGFDTNNDNRMDTFYYHANLYLGSTDEETILKISNIGGSDKIAIYGPIMILRQGLNPLSKDTDSDHINDNIELQKNPMTSPINPDTDHDYITDSNDKSPVEYDIDNDGLGWPLEIHYGTDPLNFDSDYDYLLDGEEIHTGTKPLVADSDGDTIPDGVELGRGGYTQKTSLITTRNDLCHFLAAMVPPDDKQNKICGIPLVLVLAGHENLRMEWAKPYITSYVVTSDPLLPNTDYDGLNDLQELQQGTDPNIQDSDGDGWIDGPEESAIVNNEGPEISVSFFKSAGSNTVKISVVVWSYKNVDSVELWKSPYDDGTLLDYRYWQNLHRVTFDYDYILTTAEKLRGPTFDVYSTDTKGFERLDSFKYSGGAFDQIENYISKADALTFGPIKGGGDAGGLTAWDDMLSGTVDFIEKIGSGKNLEAIEKLGNMFQTKGLGAFQSMADGVSSVQENQNPFKDGSTDSAYPRCLVCKGLTENQAHDQFAYSWYAGYIIGMIATFMVTAESGGESIFGSTGATVKASTAIAGFEAASENLVTAKDISTQAASWSAKVTAFARNNMGRLIMLSLMVGTSITLKLIWPNIFENGFTAIFGAVFIVEMAINIKDIVKNAEEILLNMIRLCIKSPKMIFSMEKIGNLFKQFQLSEDERLSFWKYADTVMDLEKGEPSELVKLIKSYKIKGNILDPEIPNQEYKLVRFVKFNKLQNPLIINGEKFTDMAPLLEGSEARRFGWEHVEYVHIDGNRMRVGDTRFPTSYTKPQIKNMIEEGLFDENTIPDRSDSQAYWIFPDRYGYSDISAVKVIINDDVGITTFYPEKGCGGLIYDGQNWVPNVP